MPLTPRLLVVASSAALLLAVPSTGASGAPSASGVRAELTGRLVATVSDDFDGDRSRTVLAVERRAGDVVPLTGVERADVDRLVGRRVTVRGLRAPDGAVRVAASGVRAASSSGTAAGTVGPTTGRTTAAATAQASAPGAGPRTMRVLGVVIRFADDPSATTPSPTAVSSRLLSGGSSVAGYYRDVSDGQWTVSGTVVGPYTVSRPRAGSCGSSDFYAWADAAARAALARGHDPASYDHLMVVLPTPVDAADDPCPWAGLAEVPGSLLWINEDLPSVRVMAHELGHNLGEGHASTYRCTVDGQRTPLAAASSCAVVEEYGDPFSVMGRSVRLHHAPARRHFGLLNPRTLGPGEAETVRLVPADAVSGVREVRIARGDGTWLALEYRQPTGLFDTFVPGEAVVTGVTARVDSGPVENTRLVDLRPGTSSGEDAPLPVGQSLTDPVSGSRVTLLRADATGASVQVTSPVAVDRLRVTRAGTLVTAWWEPPTGLAAAAGLTYEVSLDGGPVQAVSARRWSVETSRGTHRVSVRTVGADGTRHPWAHVVVSIR